MNTSASAWLLGWVVDVGYAHFCGADDETAAGCDGELELSDAEADLLMRISAATIDRRLGPERAKLLSRGRSHTKPGTLVKSQIPIRTWADRDDAVPGFVEIDLVGHEGGNASGEHCFTPAVTDISAELAPLNQIWVQHRLFTNYPLPQQKFVFKQRNGAKVTKRYDIATTPHQRAIARPDMRRRPVIYRNAEVKRLKPAVLSPPDPGTRYRAGGFHLSIPARRWRAFLTA